MLLDFPVIRSRLSCCVPILSWLKFQKKKKIFFLPFFTNSKNPDGEKRKGKMSSPMFPPTSQRKWVCRAISGAADDKKQLRARPLGANSDSGLDLSFGGVFFLSANIIPSCIILKSFRINKRNNSRRKKREREGGKTYLKITSRAVVVSVMQIGKCFIPNWLASTIMTPSWTSRTLLTILCLALPKSFWNESKKKKKSSRRKFDTSIHRSIDRSIILLSYRFIVFLSLLSRLIQTSQLRHEVLWYDPQRLSVREKNFSQFNANLCGFHLRRHVVLWQSHKPFITKKVNKR